MGYTGKTKSDTIRNPKGQMRRKQSEYATQLNEKQKVKFVYGILEKQFRSYYDKAAKAPGQTGEVLLTTIERRLDNVVYRLGFAMTRREARQQSTTATSPSTARRSTSLLPRQARRCHRGVRAQRSSVMFKRLLAEDAPVITPPQWLVREKNALKGTVAKMPAREDIDFPIEEHLIVELYSK